jgi:hypothetical protein
MPKSQGQTYVLLGNRADASITLLSERLSDQTRAVLIFGDPVAAEAFRVVENLGSEWQVVADSPGQIVELLEAAAMSGARYVALDPPTALTRGDVEAQLIPVGGFIDYLLAG